MNEKLILLIGAAIILVVLFFILKVCSRFRAWVYKLFILAEKTAQSGQKMDYVVEQIYSAMPYPANIFLNEKALRYILQKMFDVVEDFLNDGKFNKNNQEKE